MDPRTDVVECSERGGVGRGIRGGTVSGGVGRCALGRSFCADSGRLRRTVGFSGRVRIAGAVRPAAVSRPRAILTVESPTPSGGQAMEDELVASGRFVRIETRGERSGMIRAVTVGFVDDEATPGAILVAATAQEAAWARNLLADPACHVRVGHRSFDAVAEPLDGADHARAVRDMILRYGTPAEGLGRGPSFRLRPVAEAAP
jgi:deazaflavin-dependent oxidoreductase (nitroreductase family)